ncbi:MAG: hypothetical protein JXQ29_11195 [Planctomycetes bacterium]|nr:hypothetical protein [Planctomycetota bacterium]
MKTPLSVIALAALASLACTQSVMPLPAFSSTYTYHFTRGFYFQAPIDFTISGLQVPDEANNGIQNVAVYSRTVAPPYIPGTAGGLVFFKTNEPSSIVIPCAIPFKKGEFVCILGACGNVNTLYNSYGSGAFASSVLGNPTTLYRLGMQSNFLVNQGTDPIWGTPSGSIGRVLVHVSSASLVGSGTGAPGTALDFVLRSVADAGRPYQMGSSLGNGPIPIGTRSLGLSLDDLLVLSVSGRAPGVFQGYAGTLDAQGDGKAKLLIPSIPALKGIRIHTAFVTLLATAPSGVSSISNSFLFTIA